MGYRRDQTDDAVRAIVVTDDQGRYLVPDLPAANYTVGVDTGWWIRQNPDDARKILNLAAPASQPRPYYPASSGWR